MPTTSQPPSGTALPSNALTTGLVFARNEVEVATGALVGTWARNGGASSGVAWGTDADGRYKQKGTTLEQWDSASVGAERTLMVIVKYASTGGTQALIDTDLNPPRHWQYSMSNAAIPSMVVFNATPSVIGTATGPGAVSSGAPVAVIARIRNDAGTYRARVDVAGSAGTEVALTGTPAALTSGSVALTERRGGSQPMTAAKAYFYAVWDRALSDAEMSALGANGWSIFDSDTTAPTITGPGGATGASSSISIAENTTAVFTFTANETVTWDLNGGADVAKFSINSSTGALSFLSAPDFETPTDADTNNTYVVGVRATDGASNATTQTCTVTVTDVAIPTAPTIGATTSIGTTTATINWTDNSSNETSFTVQIETPSGAANWTNASTGASNPTAANATSLGITGLTAGTEYRPRVRATGAEGDSAWSTGSAFTTSAGGGGTTYANLERRVGRGSFRGQH